MITPGSLKRSWRSAHGDLGRPVEDHVIQILHVVHGELAERAPGNPSAPPCVPTTACGWPAWWSPPRPSRSARRCCCTARGRPASRTASTRGCPPNSPSVAWRACASTCRDTGKVGNQEELSLSGLLNTISAGLVHLHEHVAAAPATLLATGLTGGSRRGMPRAGGGGTGWCWSTP